jgi:SAM-dependent methyltransferase
MTSSAWSLSHDSPRTGSPSDGNTPGSLDFIWEGEIYSRGRSLNRYPYDIVVNFVFRHAPRERPRSDIRIMEVGCGAGNNLLFAAQEGFQVAGIDGSETAIQYARRRFDEHALAADLRVGDFVHLPFDDHCFDLAIDRGALVCVGRHAARRAIDEIWRVLRPGGRFLFNPYSQAHTSAASGISAGDGLIIDIQAGTLIGCGQLCFYERHDVEAVLNGGWRILQFEHMVAQDLLAEGKGVHAEWRIIVEKGANA